jgi:molybdate transport system ATP-binding protein
MGWTANLQVNLGNFQLDVTLQGNRTPVTLVGPNGSGKTTLLRTIAGADLPQSGYLKLDEQVLLDSTKGIHLPPEQRQVGYVPQGYGLFPHLNVINNVAFGLMASSPEKSSAERREAAYEQLHELDCSHLELQRPQTLSGGEKQRVALARALITQPKLLLLDEPFAALDASARSRLRSYLVDYLDSHGIPTLVSSHDIRDIIAINGLVIVLEDGKVIQQGTVETLASEPASPFVAELFSAILLNSPKA